jgi:hypothetical protein
MSHWRSGVCTPAFWLNREQCCWGSRDVEFDAVHNELCEHVSYHSLKDNNRHFIFINLVENLVRHSGYECLVR